jgi:hypothetical protein
MSASTLVKDVFFTESDYNMVIRLAFLENSALSPRRGILYNFAAPLVNTSTLMLDMLSSAT